MTTTEITTFSPRTTLAIMAELETKVLAADSEEVSLTLSLDEAPVFNVMLTMLIRLFKVEIVTSKQHTLSLLAFPMTFGMSIYLRG